MDNPVTGTPREGTEEVAGAPYADVAAAELHRVADDLAAITGDMPELYLSLDIQPYSTDLGDDEKVAVVDAVAAALLGVQAETRHMSGGTWHHVARGRRGPVRLAVYDAVSDPEAQDKDAELERLRTENAKLRRAVADAGVADCHTPRGLAS